MGIVKLQNGSISKKKEKFTNEERSIKEEELKEAAEEALEIYSWWVNNIQIPIFCIGFTLVHSLLVITPLTHAEELVSRIGGYYSDFLGDKIDAAIYDLSITASKVKGGAIDGHGDVLGTVTEVTTQFPDETFEWAPDGETKHVKDMNEIEIALSRKWAYDNRMERIPEEWKEVFETINTYLNPIALGAREVVDISKWDPLLCKRVIRRLIEKDGFVNNFLIEFIDWYDVHLFPAVIWSCTIGMFIPAFIVFIMSGLSIALIQALQSTPFNPSSEPRNAPALIFRSLCLGFCAMILFIILIVLWISLWPLALALFVGSIFNVFWIGYVLVFHFRDLFCDEEHAGVIQDPLLLPYATTVCDWFNYFFDTLIYIIDWIPVPPIGKAKPSLSNEEIMECKNTNNEAEKCKPMLFSTLLGDLIGYDLDKIDCGNEREVLKKICEICGGIYDIIWEYIIVGYLVYYQIAILFLALFLKVLSIVNPITFVEGLADPGFLLVYPTMTWKSSAARAIFEAFGAKTFYDDAGGQWGDGNAGDLNTKYLPWAAPLYFLYPWYSPITQYLTVEQWSKDCMGWVKYISCIDPKIYEINKLIIEKPIDKITELLGLGDNIINFEKCEDTS